MKKILLCGAVIVLSSCGKKEAENQARIEAEYQAQRDAVFQKIGDQRVAEAAEKSRKDREQLDAELKKIDDDQDLWMRKLRVTQEIRAEKEKADDAEAELARARILNGQTPSGE